jgi:hypothetical protein
MTRKRLWSLTTVACLMMVIPSLSLKAEGLRLKAISDRLSGLRLPALDFSSLDPRLAAALAGTALAALLLVLTLLIVRRRRTPADLATVLARRGRSVASIARETRLSQDAIRDLLGGEPMAVSTAWRGRIFRRRPKTSALPAAAFADELSERRWDARV